MLAVVCNIYEISHRIPKGVNTVKRTSKLSCEKLYAEPRNIVSITLKNAIMYKPVFNVAVANLEEFILVNDSW